MPAFFPRAIRVICLTLVITCFPTLVFAGSWVGGIEFDHPSPSYLPNGEYVEGANPDLEILAGDRVVMYGARDAMVEIQSLRDKMLAEENDEAAPITSQEKRKEKRKENTEDTNS